MPAIPGAMAARGYAMSATQPAAMLAFADVFPVAGFVAMGILVGVGFMPSTCGRAPGRRRRRTDDRRGARDRRCRFL